MKKTVLCLILGLTTIAASAQSDQLPVLRLQTFSSGYDEPLGIANCGDSRLFIVERKGKIWICDSAGNKRATPYLNISDSIKTSGSEQGLLGLVFDRDYVNNGFFYVNYINKKGNTRVSRFKVLPNNPNRADRTSERVLLGVGQPFSNHNGGQLKFGPDGYLYIALGDGGDAADPYNNAQDMTTLLGKILRIDIRAQDPGLKYAIPPTNPFVGKPGHRGEIWASGLRNPWRISFDSKNGNLWISDVGQNYWEEINFQPATSKGGENYGWSCWESSHFFKTNCDAAGSYPTFPVAEYPHALTASCSGSITGGYVYRGQLFPKMAGKYIYADFCSGVFRAVYKDHGVWVNRYLTTQNPFSYSSFGEDMNRELYVSSASTGEILMLVDSSTAFPRFASPKNYSGVRNLDEISLFPNPNTGEFIVQLTAIKKESFPVKIINQLGQEMMSENKTVEAGENEWNFSVAGLEKGIYFIHVLSSEGTVTRKFSVH